MKSLIAALLLLSASAWADVEKSADGKTATCSKVGDNGIVSYRPVGLKYEIKDGSLNLSLTMQSRICVADDISADWEDHRFGDPTPVPDGMLYPSQQKFILVDENNSVMDATDIPNEVSLDLAYSFPLASWLTSTEQQRLEAGETVDRHFVIFEQAIWTFKNGKDTLRLGLRAGGSFYLNVSLTKRNDQIQLTVPAQADE